MTPQNDNHEAGRRIAEVIVNSHLIEKYKEVFTMTRMVKVLLAVAVVLLTCSLVVGMGSSTAKTTSHANTQLIKIWVDQDNGQVRDVKITRGNTDHDSNLISPTQPAQYIGTILFYKKNPNCTVIYSGGYAFEVCW